MEMVSKRTSEERNLILTEGSPTIVGTRTNYIKKKEKKILNWRNRNETLSIIVICECSKLIYK